MKYTEEQIKELESKAAKWDALEVEFDKLHMKGFTEEGERIEGEEQADLLQFGETALIVTGYYGPYTPKT